MGSEIVGPDLSMYPEVAREAIVEAIKFQQNSYELSSDWSLYEQTEHEYLKRNIRYAIYHQLETEGMDDDCINEEMEIDCGEEKSEEEKKAAEDEKKQKLEQDKIDCGEEKSEEEKKAAEDEKKQKSERNKIVETVYQRIVEASRTKNSLYVGIMFNMLCNIDEKGCPVPVPVFKVKRCMENVEVQKPKPEESKKKSKRAAIGVTALYPWCACYVDTEGRVYEDWTDYVTQNTLPKCLMVLPMGGFYQANPAALNTVEKTYVWIEIGPSPAAGNILPFIDIASTCLGVGSLGVGVLAVLSAPIAAPVLVAGTICGAVSGAYATVRSTQTLVDRKKHQQSISPKDKAARSAWLGVVGGVAGGLAGGSTLLLNKAVKAGMTVGIVSRTTYNTIAISNVVVNGVGIGNGIYSICQDYQDTKKVSTLEVAQVVAHVLFFGNAVMNFKTAKTIINDTQQRVLQDYENSLRSNKHRKAFKRIRRVTRASSGDATIGDSETIRGIRSIANKDDFFAGVVKSRKILNASKAEVTFKDGYAMINDNVKFDPVEFSQQPMDIRVNTVNAAEPFTPASTKSTFFNSKKMPEAVYREKFGIITERIKIGLDIVQNLETVEGIKYVKRLVFELQNFSPKDLSSLIANLAKIAREILKRTRCFVNKSIEELIYCSWLFAKPKVDSILKDWGIDASDIVNSPVLAELVCSVILGVLNNMFDGLDMFLEDIIDSFFSCSTESLDNSACSVISSPSPTKCGTCSGYILSDS